MDEIRGKKRVMIIIMDGLGVAPNSPGNAVTLAQPKNLISLWDAYPHTYLQASGEAVGLPDTTYGNSEVGHLNIGAGKVVLQNLPKIEKAIAKGTYFSNTTLTQIVEHSNKYGGDIHIMGCLSDGSVHAHTDHFIATLKFFSQKPTKGKVYIHAFTDGRDTPQTSAEQYLSRVQSAINDFGVGEIASICGRAIAMDRNSKWERTVKAYNMLTKGQGKKYNNWQDALKDAYAAEQIDEYIEPAITTSAPTPAIIKENDSVIFMNYRSDRAVQLSEAFVLPTFSGFPVQKFNNLIFATMVAYRKDFPALTLMPKEYINLSLGRIVSEYGFRQLRIAESEKFPHVTYFFNGGISIKYNGEDRIEIASPNVATYDVVPEMSSFGITDAVAARIDNDIYNLVVINFANTDMVGHTGNLEACVKSVQVLDHCVNILVKRFTARGGTVIITSDHGNVEEVINLKTGALDTEHSYNPVPFIVVNPKLQKKLLPYGKLSDIAPTVLDLMGIPKPNEMMGRSLLS